MTWPLEQLEQIELLQWPLEKPNVDQQAECCDNSPTVFAEAHTEQL